MRISDVQKTKKELRHSRSVSARIPEAYYQFIKKKNIDLVKLICVAIDDLKKGG